MKNNNIYYVDYGPKDAMPIILVHAFPLSHNLWDSQIQVLTAEHRVITYDIRGHGESDVGDGQYTIELFVDDLMELLDHLQITKTIICGLSMGGYIALRAQELHPERFSALILCDTRSDSDDDSAKIKRATGLKFLKEKGVVAFAQEFVKSAFAEETFKKNPTAVQIIREIVLKNSPLAIGGAMLALACRTDTTKSLQQIKVPTLILVGEQDQITPPASAYAMKSLIPHAELHVIAHAAHLSNLENPEEFNKYLCEFLKRIT